MKRLIILGIIASLVSCDIFKQLGILEKIWMTYPRWGQTRIKPDPAIKKITRWFSKGALPSLDRLTPRSGDLAVRREYRTLTDDERHRFHDCLTKMKHTPAVKGYPDHSEYETFVIHHTFDYSPEAHESPCFLIFHRIFLYLFERLMRSHAGCHDVGMPYWDPTLDGFLPDPSKTLMFTHPDYLGNGDGNVTLGFLGKWSKVVPDYCTKIGTHLTRDLCKDPEQIITDDIIDSFINCGKYEDCVIPKNREFEDFHGLIHGCVGGHMIDLTCAPNDPAFFLYHCFVDSVFQEYLDRTYPDTGDSAYNPMDDYPSTVDKPYQVGTEPLMPFSEFRILDGLSRNFSHFYARYEPRPRRCVSESDCGGDRSRALWCDIDSGRCKARISIGGDCSGLPDKACFPDCPVNEVAVCSTKTVTCSCESKSCGSDSDCHDDSGWNEQLCDMKNLKCQSKLYVGQNCGHLPDKFCTGGCTLSYESPRCVSGTCTCEIKAIRCTEVQTCPDGLGCRQGRCMRKAAVGEPCNESNATLCGGYEEGSECPFGLEANCSPAGVCACRTDSRSDQGTPGVSMKRSVTTAGTTSTEATLSNDEHFNEGNADGRKKSKCQRDSDCPNKEFLCVAKKLKSSPSDHRKQCYRIGCANHSSCSRVGLKHAWCSEGVCIRQLKIGQNCRGLKDDACRNDCVAPEEAMCYLGRCRCL